MDARRVAETNKIFECLSGSHAYGMNTASSDIDYRGIFVANEASLLTPFFNIEQVEGPGDRVLYEVNKFMKLIVDQNPNILELLWVDDSDIIFRTPEYDILRGARDLLLSSKARHTFSGYATSQLNRIKGHNKWINNPQPETPPRQLDFLRVISSAAQPGAKKGEHLPPSFNPEEHEIRKLYGHIYSIYDLSSGGNPCGTRRGELILTDGSFPKETQPKFIVYYDQTEYESSKNNWSNYWTWVKNRNDKRSELERKFGYDTKHAAHLVRLMRMGCEILEEGVVHVKRPDAKELLSIRNGAKSYEEIIAMSEAFEERLDEAYKKTSLRKSVDVNAAADILIEIYHSQWKKSSTVKKEKRPASDRQDNSHQPP